MQNYNKNVEYTSIITKKAPDGRFFLLFVPHIRENEQCDNTNWHFSDG